MHNLINVNSKKKIFFVIFYCKGKEKRKEKNIAQAHEKLSDVCGEVLFKLRQCQN